jgi:putative GTP pyrophosphokinase
MPDKQTLRFRDAYKRHREEVLEPFRDELKSELRTWKRENRWTKYRSEDTAIPSPVQRTRVRIKRLESVEDKIARNPEGFPGGLTRTNLLRMKDLVGARLILYFVSDLPLIDHELTRCKEISISKKIMPKAYLPADLATQLGIEYLHREDKASGYASIHYACRLRGSAIPKPPRFELQVRTLAEDVWGEIEHVLGYKPGKTTVLPVRREFQILSKQLGAIDEQFALLYYRQRVHRQEINISDEHNPNPENIPRVLKEMGLSVSQGEIEGLLRVMASRGITTIGELKARGTVERVNLIKKEWAEQTRRGADTFSVVAVLGTIGIDTSPDEVRRKTREWATVAQEWSKRAQEEG